MCRVLQKGEKSKGLLKIRSLCSNFVIVENIPPHGDVVFVWKALILQSFLDGVSSTPPLPRRGGFCGELGGIVL